MSETLRENIAEVTDCIENSLNISSDIEKYLTRELTKEFEKEEVKLNDLVKDARRQRKTAKENKTIVLFGRFSTGKTTLINAMLNLSQQYSLKKLTTRGDPTTAKPVRLKHKSNLEKPKAKIIYEDRDDEDISIEEAYNLMETGSENEENSGIIEVQILTSHPGLEDFDILDLPGTGTAFYEQHEKIVESRLNDSSMILWVSGGPEEMYPDRKDSDLIRKIIPKEDEQKSKRPVIPIWNAKQNPGEFLDLSDSPESEQFIKDAKEGKRKLNKDLTGIISEEPILVWAENATIDDRDEWAEKSGIESLNEVIYTKIESAFSPVETAAQALRTVRSDFSKAARDIQYIAWDTMEEKEEEKKELFRALRNLDTLEFECNEIIHDNTERLADDVVEEAIKPAINQFIEDTTSPGGILKQVWDAKHIRPKWIKEKLEKNLQETLIAYAPFLDESDKTLNDEFVYTIEKLFDEINRKINLFEEENERFFESGLTISESKDQNDQASTINKEQLINSTKTIIGERIGNLTGVLISAIFAIIVIVMPKTGTPVDILAGIGAILGGLFSLKSFRKRMKGRVNSACWEAKVKIKKAVREPCKSQLKEFLSKMSSHLNTGELKKEIKELESLKDKLKENIQKSKDISL